MLATPTSPDGQPMQITLDRPRRRSWPPCPVPSELDQRIDIARIEGQVKASVGQAVAEFVEKHPEESVSILRSWLHEPDGGAMVTKNRSSMTPGKLTGPEKAAVVLLSLGEEHTNVWQALDEEEIKEISQAMAGLGTVAARWSRNCWSSSSRA
jgi:hypothetical protein